MLSSEFLIGTSVFLAVKFAGYRYAAVLLNRRYTAIEPVRASLFGFARMLLGLLVSGGFAFSTGSLGIVHSLPMMYLLLLPLRFIEWLVIIWLFHERRSNGLDRMRLIKFAGTGTVWTYVLDIPAAISAVVFPGGMSTFC